MNISEEQRRDLLYHYMSMEPTVRINALDYHISVEYGNWYVVFYAVCKRLHALGAMALVTKDTWNMIDRGLPMAALYNVVLDNIEKSLERGHECGDVISWREDYGSAIS